MDTHQRKKNVLYIDSESALIAQQMQYLKHKNLDGFLFPFINMEEANHFIEFNVIKKNHKLHYIIIDENIFDENFSSSISRLHSLDDFFKKMDVIVLADKNNSLSNKHIMQFPFVSVLIDKPYPFNYIEYLITGNIA